MADEPNLSAAGFLNHLRRVLDASLQRWEFVDVPKRGFKLPEWVVRVRFLGTHRTALIAKDDDGDWHCQDDQGFNPWLTGRLNGHKRDAAGNLLPTFTDHRDAYGQPLMSDEVAG